MFSDSDNPYRPPCGQSVSVADWTLFKRVFYTLAVWAIVYLAVDAVLIWQSWNAQTLPSDATTAEQVKAFFFGWSWDSH